MDFAHQRLNLPGHTLRMRARYAVPFQQTRRSLGAETISPLVTGLAAHPKPRAHLRKRQPPAVDQVVKTLAHAGVRTALFAVSIPQQRDRSDFTRPLHSAFLSRPLPSPTAHATLNK